MEGMSSTRPYVTCAPMQSIVSVCRMTHSAALSQRYENPHAGCLSGLCVCISGMSVLAHVFCSCVCVPVCPACMQGYGSAPPPSLEDLPLWTHDPLPSPVPPHRRIFCNRALNMHNIKVRALGMRALNA